MRQITCGVCNKEFETHLANKKFCSKECSKKFYFSGNKVFDISPSSMGAISEMRIGGYFLSLGYTVYKSISTDGFADLIVFKKDEPTLFIEVRTAYQYGDGRLRYTKNLRTVNGIPTHFGLYVAETDEIQIIPIDEETLKKYVQTRITTA